MKVIFTENVQGVAQKGDVKVVKPGFFRNYLEPQRKAAPATETLLKQWEERRKKILIEKAELRAKLEEIKRRLANVSLKISKKVTKKGTLYGGVKEHDIVNSIKAKFSIEIPETAVIIDTPIKALGLHTIHLNFGEGGETDLPVEIVSKEE